MLEYDINTPLISIHIPKCGGTSFKSALRKWYGKNLHFHYFNEKSGRLPEKMKLTKTFSSKFKKNVCVHGHFNHSRNFGIDDYYPEINQFITFLRDPLEITLSVFFYNHRLVKEGNNYRDGKKFEITSDVDEYLETSNPYMNQFLPSNLTVDNFENYLEENFVHIGIMEEYQKSMDILADKLNKPKIKIPHRNISQRTQTPSEESIRRFQSKCELEYLIYNKGLELNNI